MEIELFKWTPQAHLLAALRTLWRQLFTLQEEKQSNVRVRFYSPEKSWKSSKSLHRNSGFVDKNVKKLQNFKNWRRKSRTKTCVQSVKRSTKTQRKNCFFCCIFHWVLSKDSRFSFHFCVCEHLSLAMLFVTISLDDEWVEWTFFLETSFKLKFHLSGGTFDNFAKSSEFSEKLTEEEVSYSQDSC